MSGRISAIRFAICDDQELVRKGIIGVLENNGFTCVGEACNAEEALILLSEIKVDILICDISMPKTNGLELLKKINLLNLKTKVLFLSNYDNTVFLHEAYKLNAAGYLLKDASPQELVLAITKIIKGEIYYGQHAISDLFSQVLSNTTLSEIESHNKLLKLLSARELEVLKNIVNGLSNKEIANKFNLSVRTIDAHRSNILEKLNANNTADLVRIFFSGK